VKSQPRRPSNLKSVSTPKTWGKRLDLWRLQQKPALSVRELASVCCHRVGKTTIHRICSGGISPRLEGLVKPIIAESVRQFLRSKGSDDLEIERTICAIFSSASDELKETTPVLTQRATLPKDVQQFFGLRIDPFTGDPRDRSEVFTTPKLDSIVGHIEEAINYQGFVAVVGEVGSGKSLMKRRAAQSCADSKGKLHILWPAFFNMERVHAGSITSFVLHMFKQGAPRDLLQRAGKLRELLGTMADEGVRVALGFDECHRLDPRLLTALKNFWELDNGGFDRYLGLVLFGQPHFEMILRNPEFREISERLDIIHLPNLVGRNAWGYVEHRLKVAGANAEKLFDREAIAHLVAIASTPLALGNLANASLLRAHELQEKKVTRGLVSALFPAKNGAEVRGSRPAR
jgi:type II secretory pathway predicted ATPase ExeA